jgi:hypothetical protein
MAPYRRGGVAAKKSDLIIATSRTVSQFCPVLLWCAMFLTSSLDRLEMFKTIRLLATVSRPEFLPANLGSLVLGLAWGVNPPLGSVRELAILAGLSFAVITFVSAVGAQLNTLSGYELDCTDPRKERLVQAMNNLGRGRLKSIMVVEFLRKYRFNLCADAK